MLNAYMLFTKITAAQSEVALSYHTARGLHFVAVVFTVTIVVGLEETRIMGEVRGHFHEPITLR